MSWKKEIDELKKREKLAEEMGGAEKLNVIMDSATYTMATKMNQER